MSVIVQEQAPNNVVVNETANIVHINEQEPNVISIVQGSSNVAVINSQEPNVVIVSKVGLQGNPGASGIFSEIASTPDAQSGLNNTKGMTPLRTFEANDTWVTTKNEQDLAGIPLSQTITYNGDDTVNTITKNGIVKTFSYISGVLNSINDGTYLKEFVYDVNSLLTDVNITVL